MKHTASSHARRRRVALVSIAVQVVILLGMLVAAAAHAAPARGVGLFDARSAPTQMAYLRPGQSITYAHGRDGFNCRRGWFSDVSAYTWRGGSLSDQRWSHDHTLTYWKSADGGRVEFDGITFDNRSRAAVLVAGWCR